MRKLLNVPLWFNPLWIVTTWKAAKLHHADIVIVRDLPLVLTAVFVARALGARVIFDMAECYPEMYRSSQHFSHKNLPARLLDSVLKNPTLATLYERLALRLVDHTLVMIEESRDRLLAKQVPDARIQLVSNTPVVGPEQLRPFYHLGSALRIVYVGFLTHIRGLDLLVRAIRHYVDDSREPTSITVDIVGQGGAYKPLQRLITALRLDKHVVLHGWLSHETVAELMAEANVGALTYRVCGHWNHTIPNKLFDYMLSSLPVLTTEIAPIARIVRATECGVVCESEEPVCIARHLLRLRDPAVRETLGNNGRNAVAEKYNWAHDAERLRVALSRVAPGHLNTSYPDS